MDQSNYSLFVTALAAGCVSILTVICYNIRRMRCTDVSICGITCHSVPPTMDEIMREKSTSAPNHTGNPMSIVQPSGNPIYNVEDDVEYGKQSRPSVDRRSTLGRVPVIPEKRSVD